MKEEFNYRKFIIRNTLITLGAVLIGLSSVVALCVISVKSIRESRNYLYVMNTEGAIIPMEWVNRRDGIEKEAKHHIQMFAQSFYHLSLETWEEQINRSLYLADVETLHSHRENKGYYNKFIQYNIDQKGYVLPGNIEVVMNETGEGGYFRVVISIEEKYGQSIKQFQIYAKGSFSVKERNFPHNPHGLFIDQYVEEEIVQIKK